MNESAAPTSIVRLATLQPRLADFCVITDAKLLDHRLVPADEIRLRDQPLEGMEPILFSSLVLVVEWSDGTLARAYLRPGQNLPEAMTAALRAAYEQGRAALERIYSEAENGGIRN
jgi:hypothetical protein